ncbi:rRNA processing/ribosome biogenesis-domain-containing protein [Hysterangium stoloniferum]|nr:rRNA processing/ribosome biogenesis-domain-containing protein [Hysterangium stoloniferum]
MHSLEIILQLQVGSDQAAVLSLPYLISSLTSAHFSPSPHLQKWISRLSSLLHSKHPGARWAGLCLALQTSILSKNVMVEAAQNWIAVALPIVSRNEAPPTYKACIRLIEHIFTEAISMPQFQRQLVTPNVPKFSAALLDLAEKSEDAEIRHIGMVSLARLIPLYPTLHRQLYTNMFSFSLRLLSGSSVTPTPNAVITDACALHTVLHFTGGKVGAAPLWRKSLDTAIAQAWSAFGTLRSTFSLPPRTNLSVKPTFDPPPTDPMLAIPLCLDRLNCSISLITELLRATTARPVPVCIGELNSLTLALLRCSPEDAIDGHFDTSRRALEISIIPDIWKLACILISQMAQTLRQHLNPHLSRLVAHITHHLESPSLPKSHRAPFLRILPVLLSNTYALHSPIPPTRLVKTLLPQLTALLSYKVDVQQQIDENSAATSKKGKKRGRGYEGDEVFKMGRGVLCPAPIDGEIILLALRALDHLLPNPHLSETVRTLAGRLVVTLLHELPRHPPSTLSRDISFHGQVYGEVQAICNKHVLAGSSGWVNSAVGLVVSAINWSLDGNATVKREVEILLHPRLPPLLRTQPPIEALSLFRTGNIKEDKATEEALNVGTMECTEARLESKAPAETEIVSRADVQSEPLTWSATTNASVSSFIPPQTMKSPGPTASLESPAVTEPQPPHPGTKVPPVSSHEDPISHEQNWAGTIQAKEPVQPSMFTSTSMGGYGITDDQNSDEDEEMPEIDLESDSE